MKVWIVLVGYFVCCLNILNLKAQDTELYWHSQKPSSIETIKQELLQLDSLIVSKKWESVLYLASDIKIKSLSIDYKLGEVKASLGIANAYFNLKEDEKAINVLEKTIPLCTKTNDAAAYKTYIYNMLAVNAAYKGWYEAAIKYFEAALTASKVASHPEITEAYILNNIAGMYTDLKMYDNAEKYLNQADIALEQTPNTATSVYLLWTKIHFYEQKNNVEKVNQYLIQIESLAEQLNDFKTLFVVYEKKAGLFLKNNELDNAKLYLRKMELINAIDPVLMNRQYRLAANIYKLEKKYSTALVVYHKMLELSQKIKSIKWEAIASEGLSEIYALKGDYHSAYENEIRARVLKDSLNTQDQKRNIANIEQKYQAAEKDKEIAEKELLITTQKNGLRTRNIILIASVLVISLLFILFLISRRNHKRKQHLQEEQMRLYEREKELDEMRALMSGEEQERNRIARDIHDGLMIQFSTVKMNLSSILSKQDNVKPYLLQLDKAIASLRSTAHNLMPDVLLEGGLAEAIYYFCENIKQHVAFEVTFNMLDDVPRFDEKFELAVYRIVQELIQNIVKHAQANEAYIQIGYREGMLNITIEDDGIGLEQSAPDAQKGLGLMSIKNRMQALQGTVEISSEVNSGTSIVLEFSVEALSIENNKK